MQPSHLAPYSALTEALQHLDLRGKSVLITGGGYGLGVDIARSFAERNASHITLVSRSEPKLRATAETLSSTFPNTRFTWHAADISSTAAVKGLFAALDSPTPDILVNNAGYLPSPAPFVDADLDEYWRGFEINVRGTAMVTQGFLRHRRAAGASGPGVVVTLNTLVAYAMRVPQLSAYAASKAALARWGEMVSADVDESEARFISIHPGVVLTDMGYKSGIAEVVPNTEGKLVGDFITWVTSDEAAFLAGRFAHVNWDIEELLSKKDEILSKDLFRTSLSE